MQRPRSYCDTDSFASLQLWPCTEKIRATEAAKAMANSAKGSVEFTENV